ncbi:hypothetical protein J5279_27205 [Rhizobium sp. B209b/85]|nr:hypothetical protein [Rhizobium sp. B209b/85]
MKRRTTVMVTFKLKELLAADINVNAESPDLSYQQGHPNATRTVEQAAAIANFQGLFALER